MKAVFSSTKFDFEHTFDLIFKRFRLTKYELKQSNRSDTYYYINGFSTEDKEIDVYELIIALCIYYNCDYEEKMRVIFDVTDVDMDGLINQREISKLITTVHSIFADEISPLGTSSSLVNQSLANLKASQILEMIYNHVRIIFLKFCLAGEFK